MEPKDEEMPDELVPDDTNWNSYYLRVKGRVYDLLTFAQQPKYYNAAYILSEDVHILAHDAWVHIKSIEEISYRIAFLRVTDFLVQAQGKDRRITCRQ